MTTTTEKRSSLGKYRLLALISFVFLIVFLIFFTEWFWIPLAFFMTYFVYAIDVI